MKLNKYLCLLTAITCVTLSAGCSKKPADNANEKAPTSDAEIVENGDVNADANAPKRFMPPFESTAYKRDVLEICDDGKDNDDDGKTDCDDAKCVGHVACIPKTAPVIDESSCVTVDLANPESSSFDVLINDAFKGLTINIKSDSKVCMKLTGAYDGPVTIENRKNADIDIILDHISITSANANGALKLNTNNKKKGNHFVLKLVGENKIEGAANEKSKTVLGCEANLDIIGDGSLDIVAKYKNGIAVDDVLHVWSGKILVDVKRDNTNDALKDKGFAMKLTNGFIQSGGEIVVNARDNMTGRESRGIIVEGSENAYGAGKGYVIITDGILKVDSDAKALSAGWSKSDDAKTESTADDPYPDVTITGGKISLHAYAEPREARRMPPGMMNFKPENLTDEQKAKIPPEILAEMEARANTQDKDAQAAKAEETNTVSPEGLEAKGFMTISGGEIAVIATDDGINAGGKITISGGTIYSRSLRNDALDSNGKVDISGGRTVVIGAGMPEGGLDADFSDNISYSGGLVIALGGHNNAPGSITGDGSFIQTALLESDNAGRPGMPPEMGDAPQGNPDGARPNGERRQGMRGGMGGGRGFGKNNEPSELAGKTVALTAKDSDKVMAAVKIPTDYTGGSDILILSDDIRKDTTYQVYTSPEISGDLKWYRDTMLESDATLSGENAKEVTAGVATSNGFGGPGMGGPGGHRGHGGPGMGGPGDHRGQGGPGMGGPGGHRGQGGPMGNRPAPDGMNPPPQNP